MIERELQREGSGRHHLGGHKLTREIPIGRGALQLREIGGASGMVFPTQRGYDRQRADLVQKLWTLFEGDKNDGDDDDAKNPNTFQGKLSIV